MNTFVDLYILHLYIYIYMHVYISTSF
jgi:hypothetical protein